MEGQRLVGVVSERDYARKGQDIDQLQRYIAS